MKARVRGLDVINAAMLPDTPRPCCDTECFGARESMKPFTARRERSIECEVA